jgi:hypothetical protein
MEHNYKVILHVGSCGLAAVIFNVMNSIRLSLPSGSVNGGNCFADELSQLGLEVLYMFRLMSNVIIGRGYRCNDFWVDLLLW